MVVRLLPPFRVPQVVRSAAADNLSPKVALPGSTSRPLGHIPQRFDFAGEHY